MTTATTLGFDDVRAAAARIAGVVHRTPVLTSRTLDALTGGSIFLKAECFQRGGSFKLRGAYNKISSLSGSELKRGVVAFSSGNHAQAVAIAAGLPGTRALVVMPSDAPPAKLDAARGYGAEVELYDRRRDDREAIARQISERRGLVLVPPFDDTLVMAGQGTVARELLEDVVSLDVLVAPVGGGGLIAGCATAAKALAPGIRVIGVEPTASDDTKRSLEAGTRVRVEPGQTVADGLATPIPGERTFEVNRRLLDKIVLVRDDQLVEAMRFLFDRFKCVVEPSGAAAVAALLSGAVPTTGLRVGAVISGGNVGWQRFSELVNARR
jgi:threonine dehydratase